MQCLNAAEGPKWVESGHKRRIVLAGNSPVLLGTSHLPVYRKTVGL